MPAGVERTLTPAAYNLARRVLESGAQRTAVDHVTLRAVREGATPGDPLPPPERTPYIRGVSDDAEVIITETGPPLAILFSHDGFPGIRFGHRFKRPWTEYALVSLMEDIETGALHRMMRDSPPAEDAGIIWTTWGAPPAEGL